MKLCRFELAAAPGDPRSGVFHSGKVYETDGVQAIGIHETSDVRFLPPVGRPIAVRAFEPIETSPGQWDTGFCFLNPATIYGPDEAVTAPPDCPELGFEIRIGGMVKDSGAGVDEREAESFVLGYTFLVVLTDASRPDRDMAHNWARSRDIGAFFAPFVVTPEELAEFLVRESRTQFQWRFSVFINDEKVDGPSDYVFDASFADLLQAASTGNGVSSGELVLWPAVPFPPLEESSFGRALLPSDRIRVVVEGLGAVNGRIS